MHALDMNSTSNFKEWLTSKQTDNSLSETLRLNLPLGNLTVELPCEKASLAVQESLGAYLFDSVEKKTDHLTIEVIHIGEVSLEQLPGCEVQAIGNGRETGQLSFNDGHGVIMFNSLAVIIEEECPNKVKVLLANPPELQNATSEKESTFNFTASNFNPAEDFDWELLVDAIKSVYAYHHQAVCLHAAAVEYKDKTILLVGDGGAGKTTAALTMLRSGANYLSDDICFLRPDLDSLKVYGLLMPPKLVGSRLDDLNQLESSLEIESYIKHAMPIPELALQRYSAKPRDIDLLLFIEAPIKREAEHRFYPVNEQQALIKIMQQLADPFASYRRQVHLDIAEKIITGSVCERLHTGTNLTSLCDFIESKL